jgi:hypothetical protein
VTWLVTAVLAYMFVVSAMQTVAPILPPVDPPALELRT